MKNYINVLSEIKDNDYRPGESYAKAYALGAAATNSRSETDDRKIKRQQETEDRERKIKQEESDRNALDTAAMIEQPEYKKDAVKQNALMTERGATPAQQQVIREARMKKTMDKYAGPVFSLQQQYNRYLDADNTREQAIANMQPAWEPWYKQATDDGLSVSETYSPEAVSGFLSSAERMGFLKATTAEEVADKRARSAEAVEAKRLARTPAAKSPQTGTQKDRDRDDLVAEYQDRHPEVKRVHIGQAEKLSIQEEISFEDALAETMAGVTEQKYPSGLNNGDGSKSSSQVFGEGPKYPAYAFGSGLSNSSREGATKKEAASSASRQIVATGIDKKTGKKVVKYSDGTIKYAE